jgi:hypothetical protein
MSSIWAISVTGTGAADTDGLAATVGLGELVGLAVAVTAGVDGLGEGATGDVAAGPAAVHAAARSSSVTS